MALQLTGRGILIAACVYVVFVCSSLAQEWDESQASDLDYTDLQDLDFVGSERSGMENGPRRSGIPRGNTNNENAKLWMQKRKEYMSRKIKYLMTRGK